MPFSGQGCALILACDQGGHFTGICFLFALACVPHSATAVCPQRPLCTCNFWTRKCFLLIILLGLLTTLQGDEAGVCAHSPEGAGEVVGSSACAHGGGFQEGEPGERLESECTLLPPPQTMAVPGNISEMVRTPWR